MELLLEKDCASPIITSMKQFSSWETVVEKRRAHEVEKVEGLISLDNWTPIPFDMIPFDIATLYDYENLDSSGVTNEVRRGIGGESAGTSHINFGGNDLA
jgi:hypothetical protein